MIVCRIGDPVVIVRGHCESPDLGHLTRVAKRVGLARSTLALNHRTMAAESSKRSKLIDVYASYSHFCVVCSYS